MPAARARATTTHRTTGDFATHLSSARDQMIERRAARHKLAASASSRHVAFDQDRPFSTTHDDWATAGHAKPKTIVRPPAAHARRAVAPHVGGAPYVPDAPAMPEGMAAPPTDAGAMDIASYPRPAGDNGRGLHWIPTTAQTPDAVDRFVDQAKSMHASWVVFLNDGANVGANDYLVKKLTAAGIEPVMRIYTPGVGSVSGDVGA